MVFGKKRKTIFEQEIKEVVISRNRKVSLRQYESEDIFISVKADVNSSSIKDLDIKFQEIANYTEAMIKREEAKLKKKAIEERR